MSVVILSAFACAVDDGDPDEASSEEAPLAGEIGDEEVEDEEVEAPVAEVVLPNGNILQFFASEVDGGVGVTEIGEVGEGSLIRSEGMAGATPLDIFLAVTGDDSPIPASLMGSNVIVAAELDPDYEEAIGAFEMGERGWALEAYWPDLSGDAFSQQPLVLASQDCIPDFQKYCHSGGVFYPSAQCQGFANSSVTLAIPGSFTYWGGSCNMQVSSGYSSTRLRYRTYSGCATSSWTTVHNTLLAPNQWIEHQFASFTHVRNWENRGISGSTSVSAYVGHHFYPATCVPS